MEDTYTVQIDSEICKGKEFKILDTAGEEDYQTLLDEWISSASAFIMMYAINDRETFESLKDKVKRIEKNGVTGIPIIIVGNKYDLKDQRTVPEEEAKEYAKSINAKYFETSALTDVNGNVKIVFQECGAKILTKKKSEEDEKKKCVCSIF